MTLKPNLQLKENSSLAGAVEAQRSQICRLQILLDLEQEVRLPSPDDRLDRQYDVGDFPPIVPGNNLNWPHGIRWCLFRYFGQTSTQQEIMLSAVDIDVADFSISSPAPNDLDSP